MTLREITQQIYSITVNGRINGEHFTAQELYTAFKAWLREPQSQYIFTALLPDGEWYCKAIRGPWGYGYIIPETRHEEKHIINELFKAV